MEDLEQAVRFDPHVLNVFTDPVYLAFYRKEVKEALAAFERPVALNPNDGYAHYQLGRANRLLGRPEIALKHLNKAVDVNPRLWEAREQAGLIYSQLGQNKMAIINLRKATEDNPRSAESHYQLGLIYEKENQTVPAIKQFEAAHALDAKCTRYLFSLTAFQQPVHYITFFSICQEVFQNLF